MENTSPLTFHYFRVTVTDTFLYQTKGSIYSSSLDPIPDSVDVKSVTYDLEKMTVEWDKSNVGDFGSYKLLYSKTESGDRDTITTYTDNITSYSTESYNPLIENWYWVVVSDTLGQTSTGNGKSNSIEPPPQQHNIVSVKYDLSSMEIEWYKTNEWDIDYYELLYSDTKDETKTSITKTDRNTTSYTLSDFDPSKSRWYWINSVDHWGQSTLSKGYEVLDSIPTQSKLLPIKYEDDSFKIRWSQNSDDDFSSYKLYESINKDMSSKSLKYESSIKSDTSYVLTGVSYGTIKFYEVVVEDIWKLTSTSVTQQGNSYPKVVYTIANGSGINIVNIDGTGKRLLDGKYINQNHSVRYTEKPRFYDKGKKIGYVRGRDFIITDLNGGNRDSVQNVFTGDQDETDRGLKRLIPYPSNDQVVVYYNENKIYKMSFDGTNKTTLFDLSNFSNVSGLELSPDGQKVVYYKDDYCNNTRCDYLYLLDSNGNSTQIIKRENNYIYQFRFTPDSKQIIFVSNESSSYPNSMIKVDIDGSNPTIIIDDVYGGFRNESMYISSGGKIVYQSGYNLWISDLDGSTPKQLTDLSYLSKPYVEISKNEDKIIYNYKGVYLMNIDGTGKITLDDTDGITISTFQPIPQ